MKTMGIDLWGGQQRGHIENRATVVRPTVAVPAARTLRELFVAAYPRFADRCREVEEPGLAVIAIDHRTGRPAGLVRLCARVERHVAAIVGRHDACDLYLTASDRMALRQLAVILDPVTSWRAGDAGVRFHLLDLRTQDGFVDEHGRPLRGLRCDGPAIVRCGGHALFALPLGDPSDWPASPDDAWACLPERVYLDEIDAFAQGSAPALPMLVERHGDRDPRRTTTITRTPGPRDSAVSCAHDGDVAGALELIGPSVRETIQIGHQALRDGVLLGRYDRCDARAAIGEDESMSRVHALLIRTDERLVLVDTASSNGTFEDGKPARIVVLDRELELRLGKRTFARWRWL